MEIKKISRSIKGYSRPVGSGSCWSGQHLGSNGDFAELTRTGLWEAVSGYGSRDSVE